VVQAQLIATVNSWGELTVGSSSKEKPTVTRALGVATRSTRGERPAEFEKRKLCAPRSVQRLAPRGANRE
jgi:hypothetical protein